MSLQAYQKVQRKFSNPRDSEYRVFAQVTSGLIEVKDLPRTDQKVISAINQNRKLWAALSSDCGASGNQLSDKVRAQIISLGVWVGKYSSDVMRKNADIAPLIDINKTIMEGLAVKIDAAPLQSPAAPAGNTSHLA